MAIYRPETLNERVDAICVRLGPRIGTRANKRLRLAYTNRALQHFERRLAALTEADVCLDLGANYGRVTLQLAQSGATVHAFEPDPQTFAILKENVGHLENVVLHQAAVALEGGNQTLRRLPDGLDGGTPEEISWGSSILPTADHSSPDTAVVDVRAFDDVLAEIGRTISIVKMDIEGCEIALLGQIIAHCDRYDIDTLFAETHEVYRPDHWADVMRLRAAAEKVVRPDIHPYWP